MKPVRNKDTWTSPLAGVLATTLGAYYDQFPLKRPRPDVPTTTALERALVAGTVVLQPDGKVTGRFNAAISADLKSLGGVYSTDLGVWFLRPMMIPTHIRQLTQQVRDNDAGWKARLSSAVSKAMPATMIAAIALPSIYRAVSLQVAKAITATTGREVTPQPSYDEASTFVMTVEDSIRGFTEKETKRISSILKKSTAEDWPSEKLESILMGRVGVAADRAKTMARQGTAIAATELKAKYYVQIGLPRYTWKTKGDSLVRSDHEALDGQVFEWNNPPVVNTATGMRAHPGQDWNCRCTATPVEEYE